MNDLMQNDTVAHPLHGVGVVTDIQPAFSLVTVLLPSGEHVQVHPSSLTKHL